MLNKEVLVCAGTGCLSSGAQKIYDEFDRLFDHYKELEDYDLKKFVKKTGCAGPCSLGPVVIIKPDNTFYGNLEVEDVSRIVLEDLLEDKVVKDLLIFEDEESKEKYEDLRFIKNQKRIALKNTGVIDPNNIDDYIENEGYKAIEKVLNEMSQEEVIKVVKDSELRGRGGAGFPTGLKWEFTYKAEGDEKFVVCNADEGDPGAFMDRSILEGDPHSIIEAMTIAGYAVGATKGYVYVRAEYPLAVRNLTQAIKDARANDYLGEDIFGSGFDFDIEKRVGAGAFVCGEETALIASIEGSRGYPRPKPPFPANSGLWGQPTLINNVETYANIPQIILNGSDWFSQFGTKNSKGTKVFAVAGDVHNTGLVEVPFGTTLREIIFDIAGGIPDNKEFKAAQIGGPSGGTIPAEYLDMKIDYESLQEIGAIVGSGGLIIMDEDNCMVDVARFFLDFTQDESCGKCTPCRVGTKRMLDILERITSGEGQEGDIEKLIDLGETIKETSLCGLGQTAPNPVLSTIEFFRDEYEDHIYNNKCKTGKCDLGNEADCYLIDKDTCIGCTVCVNECPVDAISGERKKPHDIDCEICIVCGACEEVCPVDAISKQEGVKNEI